MLNAASISYGVDARMIKLDLNNTANNDDANTQVSYTKFIISDSGSEVNNVSIYLGGDIHSVRRPNPSGMWYGGIYYARAGERIYRDFIYSDWPNGITITLLGLGVNRDCNITIYAFDANVTESARIANWYANGTYLLDTNFIGGASNWPGYEEDSPGDLYKWAFSGTATTDSFGRIILTSSRDPLSPSGQPFAYVNALVVEPEGEYVSPLYAWRPAPFDGEEDVPADVNLTWEGGGSAATHDVYFGTDEGKVTDANRSIPLGVLVSQDHTTTTYDPPESLNLNTTYYWRIDEVNGAPDYTIFKGEVWSFTTHVQVLIASNPVPLDGARGVPTDVTLSWEEGDYAATHDVYFGTDEAEVTDANRSDSMGVLVSQDHSTTTYDPPESLEQDTTYYWRIDEVNDAPDYTIFKGEVWSFTTSYNAAHSGTVDPPYEVGTWQGFRTAAVTYTFDDGRPGLYSTAIPMFNEPNFGFKLTAFIVTEQFGTPNWTALQNAAAAGHEIASHTVTHPDLSGLTVEARTAELVNSQNTINSYIPGQQCDTLAYPNCSSNATARADTARYYIAARGCSGVIEGNTPADFYNISSFVCGTLGVNTIGDFTSKFTSAAASKGWCVFLIHGLDDDAWYSPLSSTTLRASLDYLNANRSTFWVQTFGNIVRYIRERNDVSVTELSDDGNSITLQVADTLGDANYNYPITIRRPLPAGWSSADVSQNGQPVGACAVMVDSTRYIMFDVVPDGGDVVLLKGYGDFTGNSIVDMNDLSIFCSYWLVDDCDETEGADLNEDCLVNFYEYAFLAKHWLLYGP
jgi:oligosaccharide reducing-end xylanase